MPLQLTTFDERIKDVISAAATLTLLDDSCTFAEGPVWCADGYYLFSDIPQNAIFKIGEQVPKTRYLIESGWRGAEREFLSEQIGSNGLAYNGYGQLFICQHGEGAVAVAKENELQTLVGTYQGKRFNSPNDIVIHQDGTLFFSDPPYGLKDQKLAPHLAQPTAGIYCYRDGAAFLFCDVFEYPNGVCLSPNQQRLYCCSSKPFERFVLEYDVASLELVQTLAEENGDGIKCDKHGNIFLCTKEGILILDKKGNRFGLITLPTVPANCCWGGQDGTDLLITARQNIFLIKNLSKVG